MNIKIDSEVPVNALTVLPSKGYNEIFKEINIYKYFKRIADVILSSIGIIILLPLFILIGILIKIESKGPIFFGHKRVGKDGKEFKLWKFRSMVFNAEELVQNFTPQQMKEFKEKFKLENDPRITKVGKILRKTSLDELPQLFNIIKGELSIIGLRPVIGEELEKYKNNKNKFLSLTPGLTGYWASSGRSNMTYEQRMMMELYYVDNISFKLDLKIFFRTILSVIKKEGAI